MVLQYHGVTFQCVGGYPEEEGYARWVEHEDVSASLRVLLDLVETVLKYDEHTG